MGRILKRDFFDRPALAVAKDLIGKYLVRHIDGEDRAFVVTETEAYIGEQDLACHASKGKTPRTEVMWGPPGRFYVYFIYGMYEMLNVVTEPEGKPAAVLIRGLSGISGPGRLTRELQIGRGLNRKVASRVSGLWFEDRGMEPRKGEVRATPRIGVAYAGAWAAKPYRFLWEQKKRRRSESAPTA